MEIASTFCEVPACGRIEGRMDGWKDGRMEGWKDGRMEGWKDGVVYCKKYKMKDARCKMQDVRGWKEIVERFVKFLRVGPQAAKCFASCIFHLSSHIFYNWKENFH
jgi:hypothetical protein